MSGAREEREVVVVGGGPAGSAVAARLADAGHDVLLLDRACFPRRKPCGECVNPAAVAALRSLGAWDAVEAAGPARLGGWRIRAGDDAGFEGRFPPGLHGVALPRAVLDATLLDHARARGAEVRTGVRATSVSTDGRRAVGVVAAGDDREPREIGARLVIGADGLRSVVNRRMSPLFGGRPVELWKVALTAHVAGVEGLAGRGALHVRGGECLGIADVGDGTANVTVVVTGRAKLLGGDRDRYFDQALARYGFPGARRVDAVLATGPFDFPVRSAVADGALLVGDAAGYYDPFTGQGIYRALRGAELAADAAHAALRAGDASAAALRPYEDARRRAFGPGERLQKVIEAFVSRPAWLGAVAGRFARRPALADAVIHVTGDVRPWWSLLSPALLARLVV